jgi:ParB/RepB/Spo0J family partition protein
MAKRKRLTPAQPGFLDPGDAPKPALGGAASVAAAPIAQVAGEAATRAALDELAETMEAARAQGLMIELLDLSAIDDGHLVRDRLVQDEEEMGALMDSIRARGQQTPIEVVPLAKAKAGKTHGLISGARRLTALRRLHAEQGAAEFSKVKALVVRPDTAQDAYVAMVEENEIRVNLSHYERARIAVKAMQEGVYPTQRAALQGLFGNAARSKRSKIGTFITLVEALDDVLLFPAAISEKLGLSIAREMTRDPEFLPALIKRLQAGVRDVPGAEIRILANAVTQAQQAADAEGPDAAPVAPAPSPQPVSDRINRQLSDGLRLSFSPGKQKLELSGAEVTEALVERLEAWLQAQES